MSVPEENNILVLCSDAALREAIGRRLGGREVEGTIAAKMLSHPLDAVIELSRGEYQSLVCLASDVAGREEAFLSAVYGVAPDARLLVVCQPEEEPLGQRWLEMGAEDYFVGLGELERLVDGLQPVEEQAEVVEEFVEAVAEEFPVAQRAADVAPPVAPVSAPATGIDRRILDAALSIGRLAPDTPEDILKEGAEIVLKAMGAVRGSLLSWDSEARQLRLEVAYGVPEELAAEMAGGEHAIARMAARTGEPILVGIEDPGPDVEGRHPNRYRSGSFLCMPMLVATQEGRTETVGVICVTSKSAGQSLSSEDQTTLGPLARELAEVYSSACQRERFRKLAYTDDETGLDSKRFFSTYLKELVQQARTADGEVGLFVLKADHRIVNGVAVRPSVRYLEEMGKAIGGISEPGVRAARWKENLFVVTLWRPPRSGGEWGNPYEALAFRIRDVVKGSNLPVTVSIGYSVFPTYADDEAQLLDRAVLALKSATARGPSSVVGPR